MSLIRFVKEGNTAAVNDMLTQGFVNVNEKDKIGWTALTYALLRNHVEIAKILIKAGANVQGRINDRPFIMWASGDGHTEIVELLIEKGACVNDKDEHGRTALMMASEKGHAKIVELLIGKRARVNEETRLEEYTALKLAVLSDQAEIVKILIEAGADFFDERITGKPILMWASEKGYVEIVKIILKKSNTKGENFLREIVDNVPNLHDLIHAARNDKIGTVSYLLQRGVPVNDKDKHSRTALTWALSYNRTEIVKILIEAGADFFEEERGKKLLIWASEEGYVEVVKAILKTSNTKGENFLRKIVDNAPNLQGLIDAARQGKADTVSYLLKRGASVNDKNNLGWTALKWAVVCDRADLIKILIEAGANFKEDAVSKEELTQFFMRNLAIIYMPSFTNMIKYLILDCQSTLLQDNKESTEQVQPHLKTLLDYIETQSLELFQITNKDATVSNKLVALKMLLSIVCEGVEKLGNNTKHKGYLDATLKNQAVISLINYRCNSGFDFFKGEVGGTGTRDKCDQKSLMEPVSEPEVFQQEPVNKIV